MTSYTAEQIEAIGGTPWTSNRTGEQRVYLNDWPTLIGLDIERYKSGSVRSATLGGREISNRRVGQLAAVTVYWSNGQIMTDLGTVASDARLDGPALVAALVAGIAARVGA